jgi:hypothetical protein
MYQRMSDVARKTSIPEDLTQTYVGRGWMLDVLKRGVAFLSVRDQYKFKFVHHLSTEMRLTEL